MRVCLSARRPRIRNAGHNTTNSFSPYISTTCRPSRSNRASKIFIFDVGTGMRSLKQIEASRANGAKFRGRASEKAALRYRLLAETVVLTGESNDRFVEMVKTMAGQYKPANEFEAALVDTMAMARWRQLRSVGLQKAALEMEMARHEGPAPNRAIEALKDRASFLAALHKDEMSYDRQFARTLRLLLILKGHSLPTSQTPGIDISSAGATFEAEPTPAVDGKSPPEA